MITVRIPEEIRKYKEKIMFGLTVRQLIATVIALIVCVPLYIFGRNYLSDDILSWLIIIIAVPLVSIGFFRINNMPMEKYIVAFLTHELVLNRKRLFCSENAFREWQNIAVEEEKPKGYFKKRAYKKYRREASLERAALLLEAEESGVNIDINAIKLLTVSKKNFSGGGNNDEDDNKNKKRKKSKKSGDKKSPLQIKAEAIESKMANDPYYYFTAKERNTLRAWREQREKQRKQELAKKKQTTKKNSAKMVKRRIVKTTLPRSTQQTIPFIADYEEGMLEITPGKFSKMYRLKDINYRTSKDDEQVLVFNKMGEFYNYFQEDVHLAITIDNRFVSTEEQERKVFYRMTGDDYDNHREEFNNVLRRQIIVGKNDMQVEKFLTVTIEADTPIEALLRFHKIDVEIIDNLRKFTSDAKILSTTERLAYYHDRFRRGHEGEFRIDFDFIKAQGICSKDYIAPTFFEFSGKHIQIEDDFYRVMCLNNLPASLSDDFFLNLCNNDFATTTTLSIQPIAQNKGLRIVKKQLTGIEMNKIDAEKRAVKAGYNPETIRHDIKDSHVQALALYDDVLNKDQRMFFVTMTILVHGSTLEELDENCKILEGKAGAITAQLQTLTRQQEEGLKITMPFGYAPKKIKVDRMLTTDSLTVLMPFSNQELFQSGGFYYGLNQISLNLIVLDRTGMKTPSGFVLGTSGSGKSFATKREMLNVLLNSADTGLIVIDPENEYGDFARAFGGAVVNLSASADSSNYINPLDMSEDYGLDEDDNENVPLEVKISKAKAKKSGFIMSIVESMLSMGSGSDKITITPQQRTLIDRCVGEVYNNFFASGFNPELTPTLKDLQDLFDKEKGTEDGRKIAEAVEYYTRGSMSLFSNKTNVNIDSRFVVFNVRDLGEQLRQIALTIVFDFIWNRMIDNKNRGVRTYCYCDEIHVMFQSYYAADFLQQLYKRGRKYGLCITGITQNVTDLIRSPQAQGMISNSDYIMMLNQHADDLQILAQMLKISEAQLRYVIGVDAGSGLLFAENIIVPFRDRFPSDSYLYSLMSTRFGEDMSSAERADKINEIMSSRKSAATGEEKISKMLEKYII